MRCVPFIAGRPGIALAGLILTCAPILWTGPAVANPLPDAAVFTHVQSHDPDFCTATTISSCDQIVQVAGESGLVDFGIFHQPLGTMSEPIEQFTFEIEWSEDWSFHSIDVCCGSPEWSLTPHGMELTIDVGSAYSLSEFFPVARITLDVPPLAGSFVFTDASVTLAGWNPMWLYGVEARAAVGCGDCSVPCDFADRCLARADTDLIRMTAPVGGTAEATFHGWASGLNPLCDVIFYPEAPWLLLDVVTSPTGGYDITVTADATGLAPGNHTGWIVGYTPSCSSCFQVLLTVTGGSPTQYETWGTIKHLFR